MPFCTSPVLSSILLTELHHLCLSKAQLISIAIPTAPSGDGSVKVIVVCPFGEKI